MIPGARLLTPEAVALDIPTASAAWRVAARAIDIVATLVAFEALQFLAIALEIAGGGVVAVILDLLLGLVLVLAYPALMEAFCGGRTVGKLAVGLRVVQVDGGRITFGQAAARAGLGLIEVWASLGGIGTLTILLSKRDQRLGDMAAGTLVFRERRGRRYVMPVYIMAPPGLEHLVQTLDVGAMTAQDYEVVRAFLVRWSDFDARRRPAIAATLAAPLWQRFRHPLPPGLGPDLYLACLGAAYQYRHPLPVSATYGPGPWGAPPAPPYAPAPWGAAQPDPVPAPGPWAAGGQDGAGGVGAGGWSPPG